MIRGRFVLPCLCALLGALGAIRAVAAPLDLVQSPASSGFFTALVNDTFDGIGAASFADDWSFEAETGDLLNVRLEAATGASRPKLRLLNATNTVLFSFDGTTDGVAAMQGYTFTTPGTYRVRVYTDNQVSAYAMRADLGRGIDLETEANDTAATADPITPLVGAAGFDIAAGGLIPATDTAGDVYSLGLAPAGSQLNLTALLPSSSLTSGDVSLQLSGRSASDRALDLAGNTYATIAHNSVFDAIEATPALTIEAWVNIQSFSSGWFTILDKYEATGDWGWGLVVQNGGGGISLYTGANVRATADITPSTGGWHHLAVAYSHAANDTRFYLDGQLVATKASPGALINTDGEPAYIGLSPSGGDEYSNGAIAELRLWNRALSTAEIQASYATAPAGSEANLVGLWRFDEGTGATSADATVSGATVTLGNGAGANAPAWTTGAIRPLTAVAGTSLSRSFTAATDLWLGITASANRGLSARYLIDGTLNDATPLAVTALTFPGEGGTTTDYIQAFTVTFDDELDPVSANVLANYDLRGAGPDATFGTGDDLVYALASPAYTRGTTLALTLTDGPMQPGAARLTIGLGLKDRSGNTLSSTFTRTFTVQKLGAFETESRANDTFATATTLAASGVGGSFGGSYEDTAPTHATAGNNPYGIDSGDFNADGSADLVTANWNGASISVLLGQPDGTFAAAATYAAPNNPYRVLARDLNGDGRSDVAVTRRNGAAVRVFLANADGTLATGIDYATGTGPHGLVAVDFDGDGDLDLATANYEGNNVSVLLNNGGTFAGAVNTAVTGNPVGLAAGDLNGDGRVDLAVGCYGTPAVKVLHRQGDGTFVAGPEYSWTGNVLNTAVGDVTGDGRADLLATQEYGGSIRLWTQQGDGSLVEAPALSSGSTNYLLFLRLADYDGDGDLDVIHGRGNDAAIQENRGSGVFASPLYAGAGTSARDAVVADLNADGRRDLAIAADGLHRIQIYRGRGAQTLATDGSGTLGQGRGNLSSGSDVDIYSFSARAGDRVIVGSETPGHGNATGLTYRVYRPDGGEIASMSSYNGTAQTQFVAPVSGVYFVGVAVNYTYLGEYRFAVSVQPGAHGLESEDNGSVGAADPLSLTAATGTLSAGMGGALRYGDAGDVFALGYLGEGTQITLAATKPASSGLVWILDVLDSSGTPVAAEAAGVTPMTYTVPAGQSGTFHARIRASSGADLLGLYWLSITLADSQAPAITATTLPGEGSTVTDYFDAFTLSFSENLEAPSVNNLAHYDLRAAGTDGLFDTGDDVAYGVVLASAYGTGLGASYTITDGPVQPGLYRFRVTTGLRDLYLNPLAATYTRTFTVAGVAPFIFESRSNNTFATATVLAAGGIGGAFSGSYEETAPTYATAGNNPYGLDSGDFNADGRADLVTANWNGANISVFLGQPDGTFAAAATYAAPNNPYRVLARDLNGDGRSDVAVTRRNGAAVRVFLANADGTLATGVDYATPAGPHGLVAADFDADGDVDLASANYEGNSVSVFANNGSGAFAAAVDTAVTGGPTGLAVGDLNGDGRPDLAVACYGTPAVKVLHRESNGTFSAGPEYTWTGNVLSVAVGDISGDTRADLFAAQEYGSSVRRWTQQPDGTLVEGTAIALGGNAYTHFLRVIDSDGDGDADLVMGRGNAAWIHENTGSGALASPLFADVGTNARGAVAADFNGDGRRDLAVAADGLHRVQIFLGRGTQALTTDGAGTLGQGRGNVSSGSDVDVFSFSARAGDRVIVGSETPGHGNATGLTFRSYRPDGSEIASHSSYNGTGQSQFVAPVSGVYYVSVAFNYGYTGEYRFAVSVQPGTYGLESEDNGSVGAADPLSFTVGVGSLSASMGGALRFGDGGDTFALGYLTEGAQVTLGASRPASSNLVWILDVLNSAGTAVASGSAGAATLNHTVAAGQEGAYYARIRASSGADLYGLYWLSITVADTQAPSITGTTLPAEGATVSSFFDAFTLSFSENLEAPSVNDLAHYDLRAAGTDGLFDTGDDVAYTLALTSTYTSGLSQGFAITDGPVQPGPYRFRVTTGLRDLYLNPLAGTYTRTFTIAGVAPYVFESRSNNTFATATVLAAGGIGSAFSGSYEETAPTYATAGNNPYGLDSGDFNADGRADLVTANWNGANISVFLGQPDGTFAAAATYAAPNNPYRVLARDLNGDGRSDVAVTRRNGAAVRVFLANADGTLATGVDYATPTGPHGVVAVDFDGDGDVDLATANREGNSVSVFLNNGNGTFAAAASTAVTGGPTGLAVGDLNGDTRPDLAVACFDTPATRILYRQVDGTFAAGPEFSWTANVLSVATGDVTGDGRIDLFAAQEYGSTVRFWTQQGDGTLVEGAAIGLGGNGYTHFLRLVDTDGDADLEIVLGRGNAAWIYENLGAGALASPLLVDVGTNARGVVASDFNSDGRRDLAVAADGSHRVQIFLGRGTQALTTDGAGTLGLGRGNVSAGGDIDFFSFSARVGDRVIVGSETPGHGNATGLLYRIHRPDGSEITNFASYNGTGQGQFIAPVSGVYYVSVAHNYGYTGEYRFAVSVQPGTHGLESEANDAVGSADPLTVTAAAGTRSATLGGALRFGDPGDIVALGNLADGTGIALTATRPPSSSVVWILEVLDSAGTAVATGAAGATPVEYTIPGGGAGAYYARIRAGSGADLFGLYWMSIVLTDTQPPTVTDATLPAEGSTVTTLFDRFDLTFSEDMEAATVNNLASYDLRAAGADALFGTGDDTVIPLVLTANYSSGLGIALRTANGASLPAGTLRFQALAGLRDLYTNALDPVFTRTFTITQLAGFAFESEPNSTAATATPLVMAGSQPGLFGAGARGFLLAGSDTDFWSFDVQAGDRVYVVGETLGNPNGSGLNYQVLNPSGTALANLNAEYTGQWVSPLITIATTGTHTVRVAPNYGYAGEYRFRIILLRGGIQLEVEPNGTTATATPFALTAVGNNRSGEAAGISRTSGELDYFSLGSITAGNTVFLSTRQPSTSTFVPVVSLYSSTGVLMAEYTGGRAGDGVAQAPISVTDTYYALVRTSGSTGGIACEYILDVLIVPTADISFPNLQVTNLTPLPATGLQSGQATTVTFRVDNLGNLATGAVSWTDRVVLSTDILYGNADDLEIAAVTHAGPLASGANYTVNAPVAIPDGIAGSYYVIARTDHTNTVAEFVLEGDNETVSDSTIAITRADYSDLRIEDLAVGAPDGAGVRTVTWTLANRGAGAAAAGFSDRLLVRNTTTSTTVVDAFTPIGSTLAAGATLSRSGTFTATSAGTHMIDVTADPLGERYEWGASGHAAAEANNTASTSVAVTSQFTITLSADPSAGGSVSGAGTFTGGTNRTVTATANVPYVFLGWFEGDTLRSNNTSYTFNLTAHRDLVARFVLPTYTVATQVSPLGAGTVTGGGTFSAGGSVSLSATANPGYVFANWSEGATNLGSTQPLVFSATASRTIVANFAELNPTHLVTTATLPAGIATVTGAGLYTNGQSATITAPTPVVSGDSEYTFKQFRLGATVIGGSVSFAKTFTTLDAATLEYVAEYEARPLKPSVINVGSNFGASVPVTNDFRLTLRFDRAMDQSVKPVVELQSANATSIPTVATTGTWTTSDTFAVAPITVTSAQGGDFTVRVSAARDTASRVMDAATVFSFSVDTTPPELPALTQGAVTETTAVVDWSGYAAPADLATFRVFRSTSTFSSLVGLTPVASLGAAARSFTVTGLTLDTDAFVAVVPVDTAGNAATTATPLTVRVSSTLPPAVTFTVAAPSTNTARLSWIYDSSSLLGFEGFRVYRAPGAFSSLAGLTPIATLGTAVRSFDDTGLDRAQTHHYAVVGFNRLGESLTAVTSQPWTDPLAGEISSDFTVADPLIVIMQPITITNGATFTVPPGTTVAFGPGAGLTVQSGRLVADGTLFGPIHFTSLADVEDASPLPGSWEGLTLADATRTSVLRHTFVSYGKGVAVTAGSPTIDVLAATWNTLGGLRLSDGATVSTSAAYLANNSAGASATGASTLTITGSVLKNNTVNASVSGAVLAAPGNWWGTADAGAIAASLSGPVDAASPLASEPVLTRGLRSADGATQTGSLDLALRLASLNAASYRVSEDSSFTGVLFVDVPRDTLSLDQHNAGPWPVIVPLSAGAGMKTLHAQFRSPTGEVSPAVSFTTTLITAGPAITAFSLAEGQVIERPIAVSGSATTALGLASLKLFVDDIEVATSPTSPLATRWDIRPLVPGAHRVRLEARDTSGHLATRAVTVQVQPAVPPRPVITSPANNLMTTSAALTVAGTAEPLADIRITRNSIVVATVAADGAGVFSAPAVPLVEGTNRLVATAFDSIGVNDSAVVTVSSDSGAPAPVTLLPIEYRPGQGVFVDWTLPVAGETPTRFRVFWHDASFSSPAQATGQTDLLPNTEITLTAVPDGLRYFAVVGYDAAGNASALSNVESFTVDRTAPTFTVAFDQPMPVGPGTLGVTITASEALQTTPLLLMRPSGGNLTAITLSPGAGLSYTASFPVTALSARSGAASLAVSGTDLAGNAFTGPPAGTALVFDVTKPTGALTTSVPAPVQTAGDVPVSIGLTLSEPPKAGTSPTLGFSPPEGAVVPLTLTGNGVNWTASLTLTSAMGNGNGTFLLQVEDAVGNAGTVLTTGGTLELYNTTTPTAPAVPSGVTIQPIKGGYIRLAWAAADKAQSYRLYRESGASAEIPATLVAADITALTIDDLPPADGPYRYAVRSYRLGAESTASSVRAATSDRTPPPAPTVTTAVLGGSGINVAWTAGAGETPAKFVLYRNGDAVREVSNVSTGLTDSPPRGTMNYQIAAADALGNEALGPTATIDLPVGAVTGLLVVVDDLLGTTLSWNSGDATATGYNVYRDGVKQNGAPLTARVFTDTFDAGNLPVLYGVTALNASAQESAMRTVLVQPLAATITLNPAGDGTTEQASVSRYFDSYRVVMTAGSHASAPVLVDTGEIVRAVTGDATLSATFPVTATLAAGATQTTNFAVPAPGIAGQGQAVAITLKTANDSSGTFVHYRFLSEHDGADLPGLMLAVSAPVPPLAGGVNTFNLTAYNRGHAPADLVLSRMGGDEPGDLVMQVVTGDGVLASTTPYEGTISGVMISPTGEHFLRVQPGASVEIPFPDVFVPDALSDQAQVTFRARFQAIYHNIGYTHQRIAGPLEGAMNSSLRLTPYTGTCFTDKAVYADNEPVLLSGQALDRIAGTPVPNVPLRVGIRFGAAVLFREVTTDGAGAWSLSYTPTPGLAGSIVFWAAHPEIVDKLDQARITFHRMFVKPTRIEVTMSKNDTLDFDVGLLNLGDLPLTGTTVTARVYRMEGGVETPVTSITGSARETPPASIAAKAEPKIKLRLQAALDAPDDAFVEFTFSTNEGATARLTGTISLRPALAILTAVSPTTGYVEAGLARGQIRSVEVTVQNRGLRPLTGVRLTPPATIPWMQVNLATDASGQVPMADIPVGGTRSFSVVFAPPDTTAVGFYDDFLTISGDNSVGTYRLNLFATVASTLTGAVQFDVANSLGDKVPNASIWLRNAVLGTEVGPLTTDVNGRVTATDLMEGDWQWKTSASGHGSTQGVVTIVPNQTVGVETELSLNLVSVKFSVVPVPFTDYYEIKIEQTFQTRTPIPNMVFSPPHTSLSIPAGWSGTLLYKLRNEGLRSAFGVEIKGMTLPTMSVQPLITYIPELLAQEEIEIPVFFEYYGADAALAAQGGTGAPVASLASALRTATDSEGGRVGTLAATPQSGAVYRPAGTIDDILDCYENFKYGTITLNAAAYVDSVSGATYHLGVNATIDVDELLALICDGECPPSWFGDGIGGAVCNKVAGWVVDQVGKKTKTIDLVCKAANAIKAIGCVAINLPPAPPSTALVNGVSWSGWGPGTVPPRYGPGGPGWVISYTPGCFVAGTPVTMADGTTRAIETIAKGDTLRASAKGGANPVAMPMKLTSDHVRELTFRAAGEASAPSRTLRLTHDHRVWVDGRGWVFATQVAIGDRLHTETGGFAEVVSNARLDGTHEVFSLVMENDNVFYAAGVLVEDQCSQLARPKPSASAQKEVTP